MNRRLRNAWWGTVVLFLTHGLIVSTWVSRIPAIKAKLDLPNGLLGLTLLSSAAGAVCFIPYAGVLVSKYGSKKVCFGSGVGFCLSIIPISMAINAITLAASLFVYGAFSASMDVAMNAQGIEVEKQMGAPTMSRFHGMFSLGAMVGAAIGGAVAFCRKRGFECCLSRRVYSLVVRDAQRRRGQGGRSPPVQQDPACADCA
jgi:MFS family permease